MAELTGGDLVARVLAQAGLSHVFTLCGGHILPIYDGCLREGIRVIDLRHEQAAAHAADAWARLTRHLGVSIVTAATRAARLAAAPAGLGAPGLAELAGLIGEAERPLVIAGSGVYWDGASAALAAFAERAGVPVLMNGAGRGTLPSDHRCAVAAARGFALGQADFVLVLGAPLDFRLGYGRPPTFAENVKVAMIDADPSELGRNRALALGAVGDIDVVLRQLLDALPKGIAERLRSWREAVGTREAERRRELAGLAAADDRPIPHYRLAPGNARVLSPGTIAGGGGGEVVGRAATSRPR